jgi:membrane protease YdiL (CAAX protease family)
VRVDGSDDRRQGRGAQAAARRWPLLATLGLLLAVSLLNNAVAPGLYVAWAIAGILGLVLLARADGLSRRDWGFGPVTRRAARAAAGFAAIIALGMLVGTQLPGIDEAYRDERVVGMSGWEVAFAALVRVPIGTALLEEVAFRGILLAMLARRYGLARGIAGSSLAFGVWHLLPALGLSAGNAALGAALGPSALVSALIGIAAASAVGAFLCILRVRYDHLVVPLAMHATANGLAYLLAWLVLRA